MVAFLTRFLLVLGSELRSRARLEAETLVSAPAAGCPQPEMPGRERGPRNTDRLLLVWMYRDDHPTAPRSPWQNGHAERLIGAIRHECLDRVRRDALAPNLESLCFLFQLGQASSLLCKDAPDFRSAQPVGNITALPVLGGLHHQYVRV